MGIYSIKKEHNIKFDIDSFILVENYLYPQNIKIDRNLKIRIRGTTEVTHGPSIKIVRGSIYGQGIPVILGKNIEDVHILKNSVRNEKSVQYKKDCNFGLNFAIYNYKYLKEYHTASEERQLELEEIIEKRSNKNLEELLNGKLY